MLALRPAASAWGGSPSRSARQTITASQARDRPVAHAQPGAARPVLRGRDAAERCVHYGDGRSLRLSGSRATSAPGPAVKSQTQWGRVSSSGGAGCVSAIVVTFSCVWDSGWFSETDGPPSRIRGRVSRVRSDVRCARLPCAADAGAFPPGTGASGHALGSAAVTVTCGGGDDPRGFLLSGRDPPDLPPPPPGCVWLIRLFILEPVITENSHGRRPLRSAGISLFPLPAPPTPPPAHAPRRLFHP